MATFTEGKFSTLDPKFAHVRTFDSADTSGDFKGLIALKVNRVFHNQACFGELDLLSISATNAAGSTNPKPFAIGIFRGVEITGDVNFIEVNGGSSTVSYADLGTAGGTGLVISQNEPLFTFGVNGGGSNTIDLANLEIVSAAGEVLVTAVDHNLEGAQRLSPVHQIPCFQQNMNPFVVQKLPEEAEPNRFLPAWLRRSRRVEI